MDADDFCNSVFVHGKNDFAEILYISKNLARYRSENNYLGNSSMSNATKSFDILATSSIVPYNYFDSPTKLFSDLCL